MRDSRRGAEVTVQSMPDVLERCTCGHLMKDDTTEKQEVHLIRAGIVLCPELLHKEGPATRSKERDETWLQRIPHGKSTSKKVSKEEI